MNTPWSEYDKDYARNNAREATQTKPVFTAEDVAFLASINVTLGEEN